MNRFTASVASVLEVDGEGLSLDSRFREVDGWCSLTGFGLLVLLENDWDAPISVTSFLELQTVRDLYRVAFIAFAAKVLGVPRGSLSGTSAFGSVPEWDSVAHLRLVMEAEKFFDVHYTLESIPSIKSIDDFLI